MTLLAALLGFAPLAVAITVTPGADMTLVIRSAARFGPRAALLAGAGVCLGVLVWGVAAAAGVAALLRTYPAAYEVLSYVGAAYLVYLGVRMLLPTRTDGHEAARRGSVFTQGFVTNLLNPKIGVFYLSVIPQFPVAGVSPALVGLSLAALHVVISMSLFGAIAGAAKPLGGWLSRPSVARALDVVCGSVLLVFAVLLFARTLLT